MWVFAISFRGRIFANILIDVWFCGVGIHSVLFPIIAKDLHKSTKQNEVIIKLLEKKIVKEEE